MKAHTNTICRIDGHYLILKKQKKKRYTRVFITFVLLCCPFFFSHQDDINLNAPFRDDTDLNMFNNYKRPITKIKQRDLRRTSAEALGNFIPREVIPALADL